MPQSHNDFWKSKVKEIREKRIPHNQSENKRSLREVKDGVKAWEKSILEPWLEHSPERDKDFQTSSGIPVKSIYTANDLRYPEREPEYPGEYPYTRGVYPTMYRGKVWTMRMFSGYGSPEDTNRRLKYLIRQGEDGLSVAFDMPTLYGFDADNPRSLGEVGKCGCNISSLRDMEAMLDGIPLDTVSTSMTINAPAAILTAMYAAVAEKQNIPLGNLRGTVQADMLKEYIAQKEWVYPPDAHMRIIKDLMIFCTKEMPKWNYISISGYHIREAGANAVQELAFTLANGFTYLDLGIDAGLEIKNFAPRLSFFFNSCMNIFEEIAKFRAARRIWATVLKEKYGISDRRALLLRFHTQTSGASLTWQQPMNNIMRTTIEALSAVLGGTQSLHTNSYDEAWALPTEQAVKIALRTQQVVAEESGITDTIDPLGGSYYVEWLTDEMEEQAYKYFDRIEDHGGVIESIKSGYLQREIAETSYKTQRRVEDGKDVIVGVNKHIEDESQSIEFLKVDTKVQEAQIKRLRMLKNERDQHDVKDALQRLQHVYESEEGNIIDETLRAVKAYATLQEIIDVGKEVFGEWREPAII